MTDFVRHSNGVGIYLHPMFLRYFKVKATVNLESDGLNKRALGLRYANQPTRHYIAGGLLILVQPVQPHGTLGRALKGTVTHLIRAGRKSCQPIITHRRSMTTIVYSPQRPSLLLLPAGDNGKDSGQCSVSLSSLFTCLPLHSTDFQNNPSQTNNVLDY